MSIEYNGEASLNETEATALAAALVNNTFVQLPGGGGGRFIFRIASSPPREHWPEDIELRTRPQIYVAVHSATASEREEFIRRLESLLAQMGHPCKLEED
jgi:hypothetical protein